MNTTHITVEYPTTEYIVLKTIEELKALGYKNPSKALIRHQPVNRPQIIKVKQVKRLVQEEFMDSQDFDNELEDMSVEQTGMGRTQHQKRFKRAFNE